MALFENPSARQEQEEMIAREKSRLDEGSKKRVRRSVAEVSHEVSHSSETP